MAKKILIAEDSAAFRDLEGEYLGARGFECIYATDGAEAIKLAVRERPDLILLDVQMPVMDGVQVLAYLKQNPDTRDIPTIVITAIRGDKNVEALQAGGAAGVLFKPIRGIDLWDAIKPFVG